MTSVPGAWRKRKKVLKQTMVVGRADYEGLDLDAKVELVRSLVPLGLLYIEELLDAEVRALAGERYRRKDEGMSGWRCGCRGCGWQRARRPCTPMRACGGQARSMSWC